MFLCTIVSSYVMKSPLQFVITALHNDPPSLTHSARLAWHCSLLLMSKKGKKLRERWKKRYHVAILLFVCLFGTAVNIQEILLPPPFILLFNVRIRRTQQKYLYSLIRT